MAWTASQEIWLHLNRNAFTYGEKPIGFGKRPMMTCRNVSPRLIVLNVAYRVNKNFVVRRGILQMFLQLRFLLFVRLICIKKICLKDIQEIALVSV